MKLRSIVILVPLGLGATALMTRRGECTVSMHPDDWQGLEEGTVHREYRSLQHALHHWREFANLGVTVAEIYLRRAISPAFREQIMIVTATCDECPG